MFAQILKNEISRSGKTQAQICDETGISVTLMSYYVTGRRTPSLKNLYLLSEALNFSVDVVLRIMYGGE